MNYCAVVEYTKVISNLTPDGYVEVDITSDDGSLTEQHALYKWSRLLKDASVKFGRPFMAFEIMSECMADVGFADMADRRFKWPTNHWPRDKRHKELGAWNNENSSVALESVTLAPFTRAHGRTREEVTVMLADVRKNLNDAGIHAYWPMYAISELDFGGFCGLILVVVVRSMGGSRKSECKTQMM